MDELIQPVKSPFASNTTPADKNNWMTPPEIFAALDAEFGFYLDAAATFESTLCPYWLSYQNNALSSDWQSYGAVWCNPPYDNPLPWVQKAAEQCSVQKQPIVMLLPADTSTAWFNYGRETADEIRFITGGRLSFIHPVTRKPGKNGNSKGSVFFIWRPWTTPRRIVTFTDRNKLMNEGRALLSEVMAA
ncbi:TPA: phage N-6-adenine-methyltransferase [Salmonella enterica subsp. salamae]|nr:phage N-6-adenine-methyltransferase [Salmonella enterica subsp. salamae]